jgi:imidazolonepropionase-like amidohydrolase
MGAQHETPAPASASSHASRASLRFIANPHPETTQFTIHTSTLFDPKKKEFVKDVSVVVDSKSALITKVFTRDAPLPAGVPEGDVDLRGKVVMPGFVDAHTHIFLHSYE